MSDDLEPPAETAPVADWLRFIRKRARMSQAELAKALGVSDGLVGNVERGTRNLGHENAVKLADVLELPEEDRRSLLTARDRYALEARGGDDSPPPPWENLVAQMQQVSSALERLAQLVEERLPPKRR